MNHKQGPYTTIQVILKPHALHTLLGINASALTHRLVELHEFSAPSLAEQLLEATNEQEQLALLTSFLVAQLIETLTVVAHALGFHDQSHFIRDIKAFSGLTPKSLSHHADDFHHGQAGYFYLG
jgi:tRNA isopentenyl-2-thiomethyl-A-37 hydroxylase MiaE